MKKGKDYFGFYFFAFVLPLPLPLLVSSFALVILFVNCFFLIKKPYRVDLLTILFLLFFLSDFISLVLSGRNFSENTIFNDVKIVCLLLPFFSNNISVDYKTLRNGVFTMFTLGVFTYILYCIIYYIYFIETHPRYTVQIDQYLFWTIENNFPGTYHRTYIGAYLVLSSMFVNMKLFTSHEFRERLIFSFLLFVQLLAVFFLGSKLTMALFLLVNTYLMIRNFKALVIPFVISACLGFLMVRDWIMKSLNKSFFDRTVFFEKSIEIIKENLFFGVGETNIVNYKVLIGDEYTDLIPHNVFLKETLSNGLTGLIIVLFLIFYMVYVAWKTGDLVFRCFTFLIVSLCLIEDFIYMQRGLFLFTFFYVLLAKQYKHQIFFLNPR